ncbi:MAG: hypothetical protein WC756_03810 [Taibaiella sp.]|jgi:hypothetical protein
MPLIKELIPPQGFELVRNRIAEILADEFISQASIHGNPEWMPSKVYVERRISIDNTDMPVINVALANGAYSNKDVTQVDGSYQFFIDCYTQSPGTDDGDGDALAAIALHRIMGMCRAILENPEYSTLAYAPPFSCSVAVTSMTIGDYAQADMQNSAIGRLIFEVRIPEIVELKAGLPLSISITQVKLFNTIKGYLYTTQAIIDDEGIFTEQFTDQFS